MLKPLLALWVGATLVVGKTPSGFTPNSDNDLVVVYGQIAAMNGVVIDQAGVCRLRSKFLRVPNRKQQRPAHQR